MNEVIDEKERIIELALPLNPELQEKVANKVVENMVINKVARKHSLSKIKLPYEYEQFLLVQSSPRTRNVYKGCIDLFLSYCSDRKLNPLEVTTMDTDGFIVWLNNKYSPATVRLNIAAVGSLFKFIFHRHPDSLTFNPFHGKKLPKLLKSRSTDFPTTQDIQRLKKEFQRLDRQDVLCAISLMETYGFRVGIFEHMIVGQDGRWISRSKGKEMGDKFTKKETALILGSGVLGKRSVTLSNVIRKYSIRLFEKREISCPFSVHDIRRYFIDTKADKLSHKEFIQFSRSLHKDVATTDGYIF
jgi:hypothetical protein